MASGPGIVITKNTLGPGLKKFGPLLESRIQTYVQAQTPRVQDYARRNARWTDRTGNARNGLFARYIGGYQGGRHEIRLSHSVPYGIWLEVRWASKYAIIVPTITSEGQRIMQGITKLIDKMKNTAGSFNEGGGWSEGITL